MNTECMYILKEQNLEAAKEFCFYLNDLAKRKHEDVSPSFISKALKDFKITPDYDGFGKPFKVKKGEIFVWAYGKDYCMHRLRPRGARRGFPYALNELSDGLFVDLFECKYKKDDIFTLEKFKKQNN